MSRKIERKIDITVTGCFVDCPFREYMSVNCGKDYYYCNNPDFEYSYYANARICYDRKQDIESIIAMVFPEGCPLKEEI